MEGKNEENVFLFSQFPLCPLLKTGLMVLYRPHDQMYLVDCLTSLRSNRH